MSFPFLRYALCYELNFVPLKRYIGILIPSTVEDGLIWKLCHCKSSQDEVININMTTIHITRGSLDQRQTHTHSDYAK